MEAELAEEAGLAEEAEQAEEAGQAEEPEQVRAAGPAPQGEEKCPLAQMVAEQEDRLEEEL